MKTTITVFIPTFNGSKYIDETVRAIKAQKLPSHYTLEILVIDSGSTDNTLEILSRHKKDIKLIQIPNQEFSHGGTRQQAAQTAKGKYVLFLTQDATPAHPHWLVNMIEPFFLSERVGCVYGRQVPRSYAPVTIKREVQTAFGNFGPDDAVMVHRPASLVDDSMTVGINNFFSDCNSAIRRDLLLGEVPFRQVNYAEDQGLAADMFSHGYLKAYAPQGSVFHSNNYTAREYFRRKFDEFIGLQDTIDFRLPASRKKLYLGWIRPTVADYKFLAHDHDYSNKAKIKWLMLSPLYNLANAAGQYYAVRYFNDPAKRAKLSLEARTRPQQAK